MTVISVIVGSTRQGRFSEKPAQWILQHLKKREGVDARLHAGASAEGRQLDRARERTMGQRLQGAQGARRQSEQQTHRQAD